MVEQLIRTVKTWDTSTQSDEANQTVAAIVRNIALHLWNEHGKLDFSIQITAALISVFQGLSDITHRLHQDLNTLEKIEQEKKSVYEIITKAISVYKPRLSGDVDLEKINSSYKQLQKSADTGCLWKIVIYIGIGLPFLIGALLQGC